jgi:membrane fusion protein (multidrug efflux system)
LLKAIENARQAYINLLRANVQSPIGAIVAKRYAQIGQRVAPGVPLALVVAANEMWVDANFKEDQLKNMRVGQPVRIESDIYGTTVEYRGHVAGFSPGTGSTLALLPPQNATGNWVKVVQRLPVRVVIDPEQLEKYPLHIGLSMNVRVDTANQSGIPLQAMSKGLVSETAIYSSQYEKAENHIQVLLKNQKQ